MSGGTNVVPQSSNNQNADSGYDAVVKQVAAIKLQNVTQDTNGYYSGSQVFAADPATVISVQGSTDGGVTLKILKTTSDGSLTTNSTLQAGSALAGGAMTYRDMVGLSLIGSVKYLTGSVSLANAQTATIAFTDQAGNSYSTVTNGKTLYIGYVDATCDLGATSTLQTSLLTITDGTNLKYQYTAAYNSAPRHIDPFIALASTSTLTIKGGASSLGASFAGKLWVSLIAWEV